MAKNFTVILENELQECNSIINIMSVSSKKEKERALYNLEYVISFVSSAYQYWKNRPYIDTNLLNLAKREAILFTKRIAELHTS